jgi:hypothetical protein
MNIAELEMRLADLKATALADVRRAASDDDTAATIDAGDRLKGVNSLEEKLGAAKGIVLSIEAALERYARLNANGGAVASIPGEGASLSAKARGELRRKQFVERLSSIEGIELRHATGVLYEAPSGAVVGIPTASPLDDSPNRWWLGLPGDEFSVAALLCEHEDGSIVAVVLDQDFLKEFGPSLSRDHREQEKFVVLREGASYFVQVPNVGRINVDQYRDNFDPLH